MAVRYRRIDYEYTVSSRGRLESFHSHTVASAVWRPPTDVVETAGSVELTVEVPGLDEDDFEITLFQNALVVEGIRRRPQHLPDCRYQSAEIRYGRFRLEVAIPGDIDAENTSANYLAGMLYIQVPRSLGRTGQ